jgi:hypothetical protein
MAEPDELPTVDLEGVEILAAGVRIHGGGSPPEGDLYSSEELAAIADANRELAGELKPPGKIGHSKTQRMLGDEPAAGWLENIRVSDDGTKLLADVKAMPRKVAKLVKAGAYRTRSVEIGPVKGQGTGKTYGMAIKGLAWLGATMPAVRTLDDVVKLYAEEGLELDQERSVALAEEVVVWPAERSYERLRALVREALNPGPPGQVAPPTELWVRDLVDGAALVQKGWDEGAEAWVVPFTATGGAVSLAASNEWIPAQQEWVAASRAMAADASRPAADTRGVTDLTITEQGKAKLAAALGLEGDVDEARLLEAAETRQRELAEATKTDADRDRKYADELETVKAQAADSAKKLHERERADVIVGAIRDGRIDPAKRADWERRYDENPKLIAETLADLPKQEKLEKAYGADGDGLDGDEDRDKAYAAATAKLLGVPVEEVI